MGWLFRPCHQEDQHGRGVPGEGPLISPSLGKLGGQVPLRAGLGLSLSLVVKRGLQGEEDPGLLESILQRLEVPASPEKAGAGFMLKGLWSPVHHLPWVLFNCTSR